MSKQKIILIAALVVIIVVVGIILIVPKGEEGVPEGEESEGTPAAGPGKLPGEEPGPVAEPGEEPIEGEEPGEEALPAEPEWQRPEEPMSSPPLEIAEIPEETIELGVTAQGFSPSSFEIEKGKEVTLSVTSRDQWTHVFKFKDPSLAEVAIGLAPGETRAITFYTPSEKGEYEFFCDVPGHEGRGEKGVMIVK
jgi:uncharacterized cupredoxin-like copper-binding protein